jgi:peroxiredoxin
MSHATPRRLALLAAPVLALALVAAPARAQLALGADIPMADVKMKNVNNKDITLASQAGKKGTLVVFTCNACPWAKAWESRVAEIGNAALAEGFGVVAINSNDPSMNAEDGYAEMKKRSKSLKLAFPYVVDATSDVARAFGATRTPEAFVFDAEGKLVYHGTVDDSPKDVAAIKNFWLKDAVNEVAAGKAVTTAETKAFGCTIKFRGKAAKAAS